MSTVLGLLAKDYMLMSLASCLPQHPLPDLSVCLPLPPHQEQLLQLLQEWAFQVSPLQEALEAAWR